MYEVHRSERTELPSRGRRVRRCQQTQKIAKTKHVPAREASWKPHGDRVTLQFCACHCRKLSFLERWLIGTFVPFVPFFSPHHGHIGGKQTSVVVYWPGMRFIALSSSLISHCSLPKGVVRKWTTAWYRQIAFVVRILLHLPMARNVPSILSMTKEEEDQP